MSIDLRTCTHFLQRTVSLMFFKSLIDHSVTMWIILFFFIETEGEFFLLICFMTLIFSKRNLGKTE